MHNEEPPSILRGWSEASVKRVPDGVRLLF